MRVLMMSISCLLASHLALAGEQQRSEIVIQDLTLQIPEGWSLTQDALDNDTMILGFGKGSDYLHFYVKKAQTIDMKKVFVNGSTIVQDVHNEMIGSLGWNVLETTKTTETKKFFVAAFSKDINGNAYYGFARSGSQEAALANLKIFLSNVRK